MVGEVEVRREPVDYDATLERVVHRLSNGEVLFVRLIRRSDSDVADPDDGAVGFPIGTVVVAGSAVLLAVLLAAAVVAAM